MKQDSPLRYPGGKGCLLERIRGVLYANKLQGGIYIEPFAGGAAVGLGLLFQEHVEEIVINDFDYRVYAFWASVTERSKQFVRMVEEVPLSVEEWERQRKIYLRPRSHSRLQVGFASFYMNRCNRSGIMVNGGPIGGIEQTGRWKIDARFNRENLIARIDRIVEHRHRIHVTNLDARELLDWSSAEFGGRKSFVYLDPPYYNKGAGLYFNSFQHEDHESLAEYLRDGFALPWILTYDNVEAIRRLYSWADQLAFTLHYSAYESRQGSELLITPDSVDPAIFDDSFAA